MTTSTTVAQTLHQRRAALRNEIDAASALRREARLGRTAGDVHDAKDDADFLQSNTTADAEIERDREELQRVDEALARLAAGTYGVCIACGEPIEPGRLQAEPASARCRPCQTRHEASSNP